MDYFTHERISEHIIRIIDVSRTACYLVCGKEKNALIDTGIGVGSLRDYIKGEIGIDVDIVILTHGHVDHASGVGEFLDLPVYFNNKDYDLARIHCRYENRLDYILKNKKNIDCSYVEILKQDMIPEFEPETAINYCDGKIFNLGGINIKAIYAPGHTKGFHMMLILEERTILFGDGCGVGVLLIEDCSSTVEEYLEMLCKIKKHENDYDRIIRNHGTYESTKEILDNVIEVAKSIIDGSDDHILTTDAPIKSEYPIFIAKKLIPGTQKRVDGLEGNIIYAKNKVRSIRS